MKSNHLSYYFFFGCVFVQGYGDAVGQSLAAGSSLADGASQQTITALPFKLLDRQVLDLGERSVIYNWVQTPPLKPMAEPSPTPMQAPRVPTAAELEQMRIWESKPQIIFSLSCTVYDRKYTYVRWSREDGDYIFWSSIDFNYMRLLTEFESATSQYYMILGIGDESAKSVKEWNAAALKDPQLVAYSRKTGFDFTMPYPPEQIPGASEIHSSYQFVSYPKKGVAAAARRAIEELHSNYDSNRQQLVREFEDGEKARIEHEQWIKDHPPVPQNTVINYFPIKSVKVGRPATGGSK